MKKNSEKGKYCNPQNFEIAATRSAFKGIPISRMKDELGGGKHGIFNERAITVLDMNGIDRYSDTWWVCVWYIFQHNIRLITYPSRIGYESKKLTEYSKDCVQDLIYANIYNFPSLYING